MATGSKRTGAEHYVQYALSHRMEFRFNQAAASRGRGKVIRYSVTPSVEWTATPRVVHFRFKRSGKQGAMSWSLV